MIKKKFSFEIVVSTLLLVLICLIMNGLNKVSSKELEGEVTGMDFASDSDSVSEAEVEDEDRKDENEKMVLFTPTEDWQEVKSYHKLPHGLHVRMNLQTGLKEAKLLSKGVDRRDLSVPLQDVERESGDREIKVKEELLRENIMEALKNIKNEDSEAAQEERKKEFVIRKKRKKFRSYDALKEEFKGLHINIESDSDILKRLIDEYASADDDIKLNILEDLDFLIHQIDNAVNFVGMGGFLKIIKPGMNSTNEEIRKGVMKLIGSASQSNPKVQIAALEEGLLNNLLRVVARESDASISSKAVFALSCIVRGFPYGQQKLIESGGLYTLREVFLKQDWKSMALQLKVVSLIQDLLEERANAEGERAKQLGAPDLLESLVEGEWCSAVSSLLTGASFDRRGRRDDWSAALGKDVPLRPDHDMVDKVISAMTLLAPSCDHNFSPALSLLQSLKETYTDLAYKERYQGDGGYEFFQSLANQIQYLLIKISAVKDEL